MYSKNIIAGQKSIIKGDGNADDYYVLYERS